MPLSLALSAADVATLVALLPAGTPAFDYVNGNLIVPDGALTTTVQGITSDPNWKTNGAKAQLKAYAGTARYNKEVGGTKVNGVAYATDRVSQSNLTGAAALAQANANISISWKLPDGTFTTLNSAAIIATATAVGNFVQQCFNTEATVVVGINGGTITTTAQIDTQFAAF
jgi:hypothetical protein